MKLKQKIVNLFLFVAILILIFPQNAHAYLDPGTGSYIIQIFLSVILGGLFAFKLFFARIRSALKKIFSRQKNEQPKDR